MNDIHPHWHSTGEDSAPQPMKNESSKSSVRIPIGSRSISRRPAAVTGILLVLVVGFAFFDGMSQFRGTQAQTQTAKSVLSAVEIRITKDGVVPQTVDSLPGQEIIWTNEDDIPHILESDTLVSDKGSTLYTPAIFPQATQSFTLAANHEPGRHTYLSTTSLSVFGDINVLSDGETTAGTFSEPLDDDFAGLFDEELANEDSSNPAFGAPAEEEPVEPVVPAALIADDREDTIDSSDPLAPTGLFRNEPVTPTAPAASLVPVNPYTVASTAEHPYAAADGEGLHSGAPQEGYKSIPGYKPFKHTDTGPALWIVSGASIAFFLFATRRFWKKFS